MKSLRSSIYLFFFLLSFSLSGQREGDKWVIGYYSYLGSHNYSVMHFDFSGPSMKLDWHFDEKINMNETTSNICDKNGQAILWTNGMQIFGKHAVIVADTIAFDGDPFGYWNYFYDKDRGPSGSPLHNGAIILPFPGQENVFTVLYHSMSPHPTLGFDTDKHLEARVKMNEDSSYTILFRDSLIAPVFKWYKGSIIATRHANGRDWWILTLAHDGPKYFSFLLDDSGVKFHHEGNVNNNIIGGLGQAAFSSNGNYMARMDANTIEDGQRIYLFRFDRCTGYLEDLDSFHTEAGYFTGVAFSPSERYLYADDNLHLWQWDLLADDIAASQTLVDTFDGFVQPGWFQMQFASMAAAPDGRIYMTPPAGSSEFMHVIERPDMPADQCNFRQHSIDLKVPNGRSSPNLPNYRLGPLDGSPCDTLGIDNILTAHWRNEEYALGFPHGILFTDLSYFNPEVWHWDFDDGSTSSERNPVHAFESGLYHVCLTVSNANSSDSSCQWIEILETEIDDPQQTSEQDLSITPNPFHNVINIVSKSGEFRIAHLQLYDIHGRFVFDQPEAPVPVSIFLPPFPPGMYLCRIKDQDGTIYSFKVMKQ
ncbi:MAG TPA: T9SS type A sorting domain-containing protein [Saprospiraceae bacterium]|nr:T9SS type A sorting domain-containing protein [Saprospiraceae bacterium]